MMTKPSHVALMACERLFYAVVLDCFIYDNKFEVFK